MSPEERKRAHETAILSMAYDLDDFQVVIPRERPDFALARREGDLPFGVEITQLFAHESQARFNLVPGYAEQLWAGGIHLHKADMPILKAARVQITDPAGNIKAREVPAVLMESPTPTDFRKRLAEAVNEKSAREYEAADLLHVNLVVLDWFGLPFDGDDYTSAIFLDSAVRAALIACPFREVMIIVRSRPSASGLHEQDPVTPHYRVVQLQQLLAMERIFVTANLIGELFDRLTDVGQLNRLTVDHVSRVQCCGRPVVHESRPYLAYQGSLVAVGEAGMQVLDHAEFPLPSWPQLELEERLPPEIEAEVAHRAAECALQTGYARAARVPTTGLKPSAE